MRTQSPEEAQSTHAWPPFASVGLSALLVAAATASCFAIYHWDAPKTAGYPGLFLLALASSATFVVPGPSTFGVIVGGVLLNPWFVGLTMGVGSAAGEFSSYLLGSLNRRELSRLPGSRMLIRFMDRNSRLTLFVLAAIPNPFYDFGGALAGMSAMPPMHFFAATLTGKLVRFTGVAWLSLWFAHSLGVQ